VLEAMACGRPLVCSPAPLNGLHVEPELQLLQATSVDDWVNQISRIFRNDNLSAELGTAASTWVQLNHRWESCLEPLSELLATSADSPQLQQAEVCG
jgi:glycosyltransferase involved in cell wall biosynthesis